MNLVVVVADSLRLTSGGTTGIYSDGVWMSADWEWLRIEVVEFADVGVADENENAVVNQGCPYHGVFWSDLIDDLHFGEGNEG